MVLNVNPEFRDKIPPLTDDEFNQLRDNIVKDGEVYEPIVVWNGTIVDGHNRWKIIQENPNIKYHIREADFPDKWAAFEWMYKKQLGRRNLTSEQRTYMIGKMYEARKKSHGGDRRSVESSNTQNGNLKQGTAGAIAREMGMGNNTVIRAEKFAKGVEVIRETSSETADKILKGDSKIKLREVLEIPKMEPAAKQERVAEITRAVQENREVTKTEKKKQISTPRNPEARESMRETDEIWAAMTDSEKEVEHTVEDLIEDIKVNGQSYIRQLHRTIEMKGDWMAGDADKAKVRMAIDNIVNSIRKVRLSI